ncbi:MAG: Hsp20/alpha crystallin family protein [Thermodesulfobacteriota bacterium]
MSLINWTPRQFVVRGPWRELDRLRSHVESVIDSLSEGYETIRRSGTGVYPLLNLSEDDDNLYLTAELPGISAADLEMSLHGDNLTLRGERRIPEADEKVNYHRREREAGYFRRIVSLPVKVDAENVRAEVKNGVLTVALPKAREVKPKQINIQTV